MRKVAEILMDLGLDEATVAAALLHDVIEDTPATAEDIRRDFGEDTAIIAIMSGNYTQRADVAFADKLLRATAAVESGVNLVLELPFPYSCSSAEFFARSGVAIANSLGVVDYISFGSELGDIEALQTIARNMMSQEFKSALANAQKNAEYVNLGHPALIEKIYYSLYACFSMNSR